MRNHFEFYRCNVRVIVILAFCSLSISKAMAQKEREYVPFVEEGKVWYCSYGSVGPITPEHPEGCNIKCIFTICGDTLVNDRYYKKVFCQFEEYYGGEELHYYCAIREESYQVFIIEEEETEEKLIYDFSSPEEIITLTYNDYPYARTDGEHRYGYLPGQLEYSVCKFTDGEVDYSNDSSCWIEGVGATLNNPFAFELRFFPFDYPKLGKSIYVRSCMKDGEYIFIKDWMATPIVDSVDDRIRVDKSNNEFNIYNLQGQRKDKTHPRGIYIQNGKKIVIK